MLSYKKQTQKMFVMACNLKANKKIRNTFHIINSNISNFNNKFIMILPSELVGMYIVEYSIVLLNMFISMKYVM